MVAARCRSVGVGRVAGPARVVRRGPGQLDRAKHVGAEVLDGLERPDGHVELLALLRVLDRELHRPRAAAPTPSTTIATVSRSTVAAIASVRSPSPSPIAWASAFTSSTVASLRVPSTVGVAVTVTPCVSGVTRNTPHPPWGSRAITKTTSAPTASGTWTFVPSSRHASPSATARVSGSLQGRRWPGSQIATVPIVVAGRELGEERLAVAVVAREVDDADRTDRAREVRARVHEATHGPRGRRPTSTMPMPAPPRASGARSPMTPRSARPCHTGTVVPRSSSSRSRTYGEMRRRSPGSGRPTPRGAPARPNARSPSRPLPDTDVSKRT